MVIKWFFLSTLLLLALVALTTGLEDVKKLVRRVERVHNRIPKSIPKKTNEKQRKLLLTAKKEYLKQFTAAENRFLRAVKRDAKYKRRKHIQNSFKKTRKGLEKLTKRRRKRTAVKAMETLASLVSTTARMLRYEYIFFGRALTAATNKVLGAIRKAGLKLLDTCNAIFNKNTNNRPGRPAESITAILIPDSVIDYGSDDDRYAEVDDIGEHNNIFNFNDDSDDSTADDVAVHANAVAHMVPRSSTGRPKHERTSQKEDAKDLARQIEKSHKEIVMRIPEKQNKKQELLLSKSMKTYLMKFSSAEKKLINSSKKEGKLKPVLKEFKKARQAIEKTVKTSGQRIVPIPKKEMGRTLSVVYDGASKLTSAVQRIGGKATALVRGVFVDLKSASQNLLTSVKTIFKKQNDDDDDDSDSED